MTSSIIISLLVGALTGAGFGAIYLILLWIAVHRLLQQRGVPAFVAFGMARITLLVIAAMTVASLKFPVEGIATMVLGFMAVRLVATRLLTDSTLTGTAWK